jgi:hypothetical protein
MHVLMRWRRNARILQRFPQPHILVLQIRISCAKSVNVVNGTAKGGRFAQLKGEGKLILTQAIVDLDKNVI